LRKTPFTHAFVLVNVEIGAESKIIAELRSVPEIIEAWVVYGVYDIVLKVKADNPETLKEAVSERIRKIDGVRNTLTLIPIEGFPQ
jgi:DNA-binding Lrp family transcriptional regulator